MSLPKQYKDEETGDVHLISNINLQKDISPENLQKLFDSNNLYEQQQVEKFEIPDEITIEVSFYFF